MTLASISHWLPQPPRSCLGTHPSFRLVDIASHSQIRGGSVVPVSTFPRGQAALDFPLLRGRYIVKNVMIQFRSPKIIVQEHQGSSGAQAADPCSRTIFSKSPWKFWRLRPKTTPESVCLRFNRIRLNLSTQLDTFVMKVLSCTLGLNRFTLSSSLKSFFMKPPIQCSFVTQAQSKDIRRI